MKGLTLLKNTHPELIKEWDFEKNVQHSWDTISTSSGHKVWWKCKNGHSWDAAVFSRTSKTEPCGCRYCCHNSPPTTNRNFATEYPELLSEWDYDKNTVDPSTVSPKSCKTFWWKCKYGHSWKTRAAHRANGHKCPRCNNKSSMLQIFIFCEIKYFFTNAEYCKKINGIECDIYLPTENIAIELDSTHWHKNKTDMDTKKVHKLQDLGINIISIREYSQPIINPNTVGYSNNNDQLEITKNLAKFLGNLLNRQDLADYSQGNTPVNDKEYFTEITRYPFSFTKSLEESNPELAKQWDYEKNGKLKPSDIVSLSHLKVWWKCEKGHSWRAIVSNRQQFNHGCPQCSSHSSFKYRRRKEVEAQCPKLPLE